MSDQIWPKETLGGLFDIGAGKAMSPSARLGERTYPFLRTANVFWGEVDLTKLDTMNFSEGEIEYKSLKKGDLLICEGGDIGRSAIWQGEVEKCGFQNHIHRLRPKTPDVVPAFFMYYLQAGFTQLGIYEGAGNKTTIPNLSRGRLAVLEVPNPPKPEQEKISAMLWKIQRAIQIEEKLTATANDLKRSAMRQLFTCGLRGEPQKETDIGQIPKSWDVQPLEKKREFLQYGTSLKCGYTKKGNPVIRIPNIMDGRVSCDDLKWCEFSEREIESLALEPGDVLFIRTNGVRDRVGTCAVYRGKPERALFASYLIRARLKTDELDPSFFQYFTATAAGLAQLGGQASPAADGKFNVNTKTIDSVLVPLPDPDEQKEIAAIMQTIDRKISVHERKRAALSDLFQTMLNQLMTAQIRVDKLDIDTREVTALNPQ